MTETIKYDWHVENLIAGLNETGHVTHTKYKKKSVTLHHNGGVNVSHQGILNIWKTRPASAHFDIDGNGHAAQYAEVHEYAWAVANTKGNQESISIEMANSTAAPHWEVSEITWRHAARLAAWLFVHVIGEKPSKENLFYHHHWYATDCAGPYMDKIYDDVLALTQHHYVEFKRIKEAHDNK